MAFRFSAPAEAAPAVVRAICQRREGRTEWLGLVCEPTEAAGKLDPQPTADALVQAAECHLAGCGVARGSLQITLFFEL